MAFVHYLGWIPIYNDRPASLWDELVLLSIPAAAVGFRASALIMRLTRSSMLEVLRQDYIRTARAKGASPTAINYDHALRNAVLPVITIIGIEAAFLIGGLIVTETVFNIPGVARFLVEAIRWRDYPIVQNLVMFIALRGDHGQLPDRHGLCRARSAHQVRELSSVAVIDHRAELSRAGAGVVGFWGTAGFLARRHPLGAAGAVIVAGLRADGDVRRLDHRLRPDGDQPARLARPAQRGAHPRRRLHGPRHVEPHRLRRAHLARGRHRLDRARLPVRRRRRPAVGLFRRLARSDRAAPHRHHAVAAAAGDGAGDGRRARSVARQHHHRDLDPAGAARRARDPLQHADAARDALRRGGAGRRHERVGDRDAPRAAEHAGAADRAGDRAARLRDPDRSRALVPRSRRSRAASVVGPHAVGVGRRICPHRAVAGDLPGRRDQSRRCSAPTCSATRCATSSIRASGPEQQDAAWTRVPSSGERRHRGAARCPGPANLLLYARRHPQSGRRRQLLARRTARRWRSSANPAAARA